MCTFHTYMCVGLKHTARHTIHTGRSDTGESTDLIQDQWPAQKAQIHDWFPPGPWSKISGIASHKLPFKNDFPPLTVVSIVY